MYIHIYIYIYIYICMYVCTYVLGQCLAPRHVWFGWGLYPGLRPGLLAWLVVRLGGSIPEFLLRRIFLLDFLPSNLLLYCWILVVRRAAIFTAFRRLHRSRLRILSLRHNGSVRSWLQVDLQSQAYQLRVRPFAGLFYLLQQRRLWPCWERTLPDLWRPR